MAEKISTVIIKVDLDCCLCSKKIKKALCTLQKQFKNLAIVYDEKNNTVIVSGPFNPDCFIKKICCLAHKVIKDIHVKKPDPPKPTPTPDPAKPTPPSKPPKPTPTPDPPKPTPQPPPPAPPPEVVVNFPTWAIPTPIWPVCCSQPCPCYKPHHGCCRCCSCGRVSGAPPQPPARRPMYYDSSPCCELGGYKIVCEDEPSYGCSIM